MALGAEMAEEVGADILDVNCGCPAPKVVKNGGGSGLLREPARLETILKGIKKAITIPLTLKVRTGYTESTINVVEIAKWPSSAALSTLPFTAARAIRDTRAWRTGTSSQR